MRASIPAPGATSPAVTPGATRCRSVAALALVFALALAGGGCGMLAEDYGGAENLPNRGVIPYETVLVVPPGDDVPDAGTTNADVDVDADVPEPEGEPWILMPEEPLRDKFSAPSAVRRPDGRVALFWQREVDGESRIELGLSDDGGLTFADVTTALGTAAAPDWVDGAVGAPAVIQRADGSWAMAVDYGGRAGIAVATSVDGLTFQWPDRPALTARDGEPGGIGAPSIVERAGRLHLYYDVGVDDDAQGTHIARAVGTSGGEFAPGDVVLAPGEACTDFDGSPEPCWDAERVGTPEVRVATTAAGKETWRMWYHGARRSKGDVGFAASADGVTWQRFPYNPILDGSGDERDPTNLLLGDRFLLFFYNESSRRSHGLSMAINAEGAPSERF